MANAVSWLKGSPLKKATTLHLKTLNGRASMVNHSRNYLLQTLLVLVAEQAEEEAGTERS